jgi:hypothetical protein
MICNLRKQQSELVLSVLFDVKHSLGIKSLLWWVSLQPLTLLKDICHPLMWHYVKKFISDICLQIGQSEDTDLCFPFRSSILSPIFIGPCRYTIIGGNQAPELIVGSTDKQPLIEAPGEVGCLTWENFQFSVLPHHHKRWRDGGGIMYSKVLFFDSDKWWWLSMEDFWAAEAAPNKFYLWLQHPCIYTLPISSS